MALGWLVATASGTAVRSGFDKIDQADQQERARKPGDSDLEPLGRLRARSAQRHGWRIARKAGGGVDRTGLAPGIEQASHEAR